MTVEDHGLYVNSGERKRSIFYSMVGTAEYISPESIINQGSLLDPLGVDLWALGCIIYRLFEGKTPFAEQSEDKIFEKIKKVDLNFTEETPEEAKDLILKLLVKIPEDRLGYQDIDDIKAHSFFSGINFNNITKMDPPDEELIRTMTKVPAGKSSMNLPTLSKSKSVNMTEDEEAQSKPSSSVKMTEDDIQMESIKKKLKFLEAEMVFEGN